jgi:hypothetical protein
VYAKEQANIIIINCLLSYDTSFITHHTAAATNFTKRGSRADDDDDDDEMEEEENIFDVASKHTRRMENRFIVCVWMYVCVQSLYHT